MSGVGEGIGDGVGDNVGDAVGNGVGDGIGFRRIAPLGFRKEEKRVSNALYALCKMFSESHVPGIQTLTNESAGFKSLILGMASSASMISSENDRRTRYKVSIRVESIKKIVKNAYTFHIQEKNSVQRLGLFTCARREVTLLSEDMLHRVYSTFDTLFSSLLYTLGASPEFSFISQEP